MANTKPDHWYDQSGVVPFRVMDGRVEVLLITSVRKGNWIVPKGIIEDGHSAEESALKEALEEAGIEGHITGEELGRYEQTKWGGICRVRVFAMRVEKQLDDWPEANVRQRQWMSLDEAAEAVKNRDLARSIRTLSETNMPH
jgi:phosphohistidine phosphatase